MWKPEYISVDCQTVARKYLGTRLENKNTFDGNPDSAQATKDVEVPLKRFWLCGILETRVNDLQDGIPGSLLYHRVLM
jgi:hypothetical protein